MVAAIDTIKFIPVIRNNASARKVPIFLGARMYVDFSEDAQYDAKLEELARAIHGAPAVVLPPLGENPFKGEVIASAEPVRVAGPSGATPAGVPILSDEWFQSQHKTAASGMQHLNVSASGGVPAINALGAMEVRLGLHSGLNKSPIELLNAVRTSQVHTFGWPIGVFSESQEEYKARPFGDGIRAEISIHDEDRKSYDYWTARKNGDFYVLQSFFEDQREARNILFFNTRIVRVTEALLFASRFYAALGAAPDARISARFTHRGLAGRTLTSSVINRYVSGTPKSHEPVSETEAVIVLRDIQAALVDEVERVCAPMFMLFDFTQFAREVYEDIVLRFKKGEVS